MTVLDHFVSVANSYYKEVATEITEHKFHNRNYTMTPIAMCL